MKHYADIDCDQFLYPHRNPDFRPDRHWTCLPAGNRQTSGCQPAQHKILLAPHPEFRDSVVAAVSNHSPNHRGWRNPQPYHSRMAKQPQRSRSN